MREDRASSMLGETGVSGTLRSSASLCRPLARVGGIVLESGGCGEPVRCGTLPAGSVLADRELTVAPVQSPLDECDIPDHDIGGGRTLPSILPAQGVFA